MADNTSGAQSAEEIFYEKFSSTLSAMEQVLEAKAALEEREKQLKAVLLSGMEETQIKKYESDTLSVTYVAATVTNKLDSKKLRAELPDIAEKYTKQSAVSAYIKAARK